MPFQDNTCVPSALIMGNGTVVMGVVDVEAPTTVLPQGAIPYSVVRFFVATLETIRKRGTLALVTLVFGDGV